MYYSNKLLKPSTACYYKKEKITYGTGIEQINCRFIDAMFVFCNLCASAASYQHERAQKTVFSHLNTETNGAEQVNVRFMEESVRRGSTITGRSVYSS